MASLPVKLCSILQRVPVSFCNHLIRAVFQKELNKMKAAPEYKDCDFSVVKPLTIVDIDTLILYRTNFENGELNLFEIIEAYQDYVDFKSASDSNYERSNTTFRCIR